MMKLQVLCIAIATIVTSATYLTIVEIPIHQSSNNPNNKTNLNTVSITNDITVNHMNKISLQEANNIKNNIFLVITEKLNTLNCQEAIDYTIEGLDLIVENQDLNRIIGNIIVSSTTTTNKITGSSSVNINVQENINDRKVESPITIPKSEENGISDWWASFITTEIKRQAFNILNISQSNILGIDYTIKNINKIKQGASFKNFKDIIFIQSTSTSTKLTGSFKVDFLLTNN